MYTRVVHHCVGAVDIVGLSSERKEKSEWVNKKCVSVELPQQYYRSKSLRKRCITAVFV